MLSDSVTHIQHSGSDPGLLWEVQQRHVFPALWLSFCLTLSLFPCQISFTYVYPYKPLESILTIPVDFEYGLLGAGSSAESSHCSWEFSAALAPALVSLQYLVIPAWSKTCIFCSSEGILLTIMWYGTSKDIEYRFFGISATWESFYWRRCHWLWQQPTAELAIFSGEGASWVGTGRVLQNWGRVRTAQKWAGTSGGVAG